ncbi:DUF3189 family protein [Alkaliphilus serpentinus]|uniref:DUF3189 family protein n=1 Tax=Alkaliphilus serpentinus TaxID=1482731 RepID=A0A833HRD8_9FIRM|nr:DUF3189 family protein [Alkaliphilus serpentinus]KAB3533167.1 DUF3189 family protein [Alkaliphilus serpentinus]
MKIFYSCYGGAHSSIITANIHLGLLPDKRVATIHEIIHCPYFDATKSKEIGRPIFMGEDSLKNQIFALGMASSRNQYTQLLYEYVRLQQGSCRGEILIINTIPLINLKVRVGGFLSRKLNLISIGRPLVAIGIQNRYMNFVKLVENLKASL